MSVRSETELAPDARAAFVDFMRAVESSLAGLDRQAAADALDDVRAHLLSALEADATAGDVAQVTAELGEPDEYAAAFRAELGESDESDSRWSSGTLLGVPYEMRIPTAERVASRWWDPRDPRVFMPRVFGIGWDLNFGALAVRLHLIEPDAEDEPFATVPDGAFLVALLVPVALTAFVVGSFLGLYQYLPEQLPTHWNLRGEPDRFASVWSAYLFPLVASAGSTAWAAWSVARHRPPLNKGATIGFAAFLSAVAAAVWSLTLATVFGVAVSSAAMAAGLVAAVAMPLVVLTALARVGRREELRRDLRSGGSGADAPADG